MLSNEERTFIAIKPDGVKRGLIGRIIGKLEDKGYKIVALKMLQVCGVRFERLLRDNFLRASARVAPSSKVDTA